MKQIHTPFAVGTLLALLLSNPTKAQAQSQSDFNALRNQVEALEKRLSEYEGTNADTTANKLKLSESVNELKLSGDVRLRYQYDQLDDHAPRPDTTSPSGDNRNVTQRSRYRYRLRLNADFKLKAGFFGGVRLQTGENSDSAEQTFDDGFNNNEIYISRAFLGWKNDWLTLVGGKQPNPLYTTDLVWDGDINPAGLTQSVRFHELFGGASEEIGYSKDGKTVVSSKPIASPWELTLNLAQLVYDDNAESAWDNDASDDAYIFVGQLVGTYHFNDKVSLTIAPGAQLFTASDLSGFSNAAGFYDVTGVSGESRDLAIITAPGDVSFKLGKLPAKFYWDFAYNTKGKERYEDIYGIVTTLPNGERRSDHKSVDNLAFLAGVTLGKNKKAGDWSVDLNFRQSGIASLDPNLNDSTFALSLLNTRGPEIGISYNITDFLWTTVTYSHAWQIRDDLFGGQATGGSRIANGNSIDVLQVDLTLKF